MTSRDAIAINEVRVTIDAARRRHERQALIDSKENRPLMAIKEAHAARILQRFGPGETIVVRTIG